MKNSITIASLALLSACAAKPVAVPRVSAPPASPSGLAAVLGKPAPALVALFGTPALDTKEEGARRLQFRSGICTLDAYLYAPREGAEQVVTWIDARQVDGRDLDRASCVAALQAARR